MIINTLCLILQFTKWIMLVCSPSPSQFYLSLLDSTLRSVLFITALRRYHIKNRGNQIRMKDSIFTFKLKPIVWTWIIYVSFWGLLLAMLLLRRMARRHQQKPSINDSTASVTSQTTYKHYHWFASFLWLLRFFGSKEYHHTHLKPEDSAKLPLRTLFHFTSKE